MSSTSGKQQKKGYISEICEKYHSRNKQKYANPNGI